MLPVILLPGEHQQQCFRAVVLNGGFPKSIICSSKDIWKLEIFLMVIIGRIASDTKWVESEVDVNPQCKGEKPSPQSL